MSPSKEQLIRKVFFLVLALYLGAVLLLVIKLPITKPLGGPDESLHISLTEYLVNHHSWPAWDSPGLKRYINGASYATCPSFGYWIEAVLLEITGRSRLSGFLFYSVIIGVLVYLFRKSPFAGMTILALMTPQTLFIFSYVNADAWSCMIAFLLGCSIVRFRKDPYNNNRIIELLTISGACVASRFHLWALGFVALLYAIVPYLGTIIQKNRKGLITGLVLGTIIASWWPVTMFTVNDGDITGMSSAQKSMEKYGEPDAKSLPKPLSEFDWPHFLFITYSSFYGWWGWMSVPLFAYQYLIALPLFACLVILVWSRMRSWLPFFLFLSAINVALLIIFSTTYDYQPQGRLLFGSYFIILGIMSCELVSSFSKEEEKKKPKNKKKNPKPDPSQNRILIVSSFLIAWNLFSAATLYSKISSVDDSFYNRAGLHLLKSGEWEEAEKNFRASLKIKPDSYLPLDLLGIVVQKQDRPEEAEALFKKSIEILPSQLNAYVHLAEFYVEQDRIDEAITQGNLAVQLHPNFIGGYRALISAYEVREDTEKIRELCYKIQEIHPDNMFANEYLLKLDSKEKESGSPENKAQPEEESEGPG